MELRSWILLLGWLVGWWLLWRVPWLRGDTVTPDGSDAPGGLGVSTIAPGCTVIIPARNEEASLGNLLDSLGTQTVGAGQVLVVDDQSGDRTAAIARAHPGVTLLAGEPVPDGWTGKAWACHQAVARASGETLVFIDADVVLGPGGLEALLAEHGSRQGLVSVQPFHRMVGAYERLSAVFNVIAFMGVRCASPGRDALAHGAFGPVLVTSRSDYDLVGGHRAVRGEIVEDIALARRYTDAGRSVHAFGGGHLARFRMYPGGLGQLIEGWSKNIATGASTVAPARLALIGFWLTCVLVSVQSVIELVMGRPTIGWVEVALCYLLFAAQFGVMLRQVGNFGVLSAALYPGPVGIFLVVFVRSAYLTVVRRRVTWRGRAVPLSRTRRWERATVPTDE